LGTVREDVVEGRTGIFPEVRIERHGLVTLAPTPVPVTIAGQIRADLVNPS